MKKIVTVIGWLVLLIVAAAGIFAYVFVNSPETIPSGVGVLPLPIEISERSSLVFMGRVIIITNTSNKTLYNIKITCEGNEIFAIYEPALKPSSRISIGWRQGVDWSKYNSLLIAASGYTTHRYYLED